MYVCMYYHHGQSTPGVAITVHIKPCINSLTALHQHCRLIMSMMGAARAAGILAAVVAALVLPPAVLGLDNGLALTPPMGWLAWERFRCNTDCINDPKNCISENLFFEMADRLVADGYLAAGYEYINIDDCWSSRTRGDDGRLRADPERFPSGIKAIADYVHSKGLKLGIYGDYGNYTCAGYPGSLGHLQTDAQTFAEWNVDFVKFDGCYAHPKDMDKGYPEFGFHLNQTGRQMVYSCSWPVYQIFSGMTPDYASIAKHCNLWRNYDDIQDSWASVTTIIDYYGDNQDVLIPLAGPGHWNDPDMLIIGNFGLSYEQSKAQMALWVVMASPLLSSVDLRTIGPEYRAILQNRAAIAISQDPLGIQGKRIFKDKGIEIWARPITPVVGEYYSYAIVFFNRRVDGTPSQVSVTIHELGMLNAAGYRTEDVFAGQSYGVLYPADRLKVDVNPSGVVLVRCSAVPARAFGRPPQQQLQRGGRPFFTTTRPRFF
ncbi:alpha-N-acetylgalactosaminidase-like isoform X3 [Amphibalanus amphitrite]|nr:alpha-N-acetylgalactosaminidase-like isoform X3 [Amphibalanus amphitrite]XP_043244617.1 alpha-N-acetylgalactosaminidase-like isoform X3 [Amphibalanus amphitrite]